MKVPEKHLDLFKRYLTREEAEEIIPRFEKNYSKDFAKNGKKQIKTGSAVLNLAFNWEKSPEGHEYWKEIHDYVLKRCVLDSKYSNPAKQ